MLRWSWILIAWASVLRAEAPHPETVAAVDLNRYVGIWYEIAKIPNRFQKDCARGTTAQYTMREDGTLEVINRCLEDNGKIKQATGVAKVVDRDSAAKLKVSFVSLFGWRLFWGDYWIFGLGEDYGYAVVGSPNRKYGWILSREPTMEPHVLQQAFEILLDRGFDPADFERTSP